MNPNKTTPKHIAVIMDGNGRWAKSHGLPRREGHRAGAESLRAVAERCIELDIPYLTAYAFSSENWKRPQKEVDTLMQLLSRFLTEKAPEMAKRGVRLHTIGETDRLPKKIQQQLKKICTETAENSNLTLTLALSYGARNDILLAAKKLATQVAEGTLRAEDIDETNFGLALSTAEIPDPDLLIRTSGEHRISNFLLWEMSYAELVFSSQFWPEFRKDALDSAIATFQKRQRRFGAL